jgi:transglutaminase-like putative cysteine protease
MRLPLVGLALSLTLAPAVRAQAPVVTPAGDPSVRADSIYRLALPAGDPRAADDAYVYLLDDGIIRYEADGRGRRTYRQIVQILQPDAVETWAEQSFGYDPGHEHLTVNWLRVLRPDGSVVSESPTLAQDADVPAATNAPVYSARKVRRFSLSGVAPGTIVDYSFTVEETKPWLAGDFYRPWRITTGRFTARSRYVVDVPAALKPHLVEINSHHAGSVREAQGRRIYTWTAQNVTRAEPPLFATDSNDQVMEVEMGGALAWSDVGRWYAGLARDRYALTPALETKLHELVAGAATLDDSLRAVHRWVAQDVRYVSITLGIGGYQPRPPADVLATGYGDCKDKATLFIALARRLGAAAYPVLLNAGGRVERRVPSLEQLDHAIAVVERPSGPLWLDLTSELTPWGELPPSDQGEFALVVRDDGRTDEVTLPETAPAGNLQAIALDGTLGTDGVVDLRYTETSRGARQYEERANLSSALDPGARNKVADAIATRLFTGATGDSLRLFDGRDLRAEATISLRIRGGRAAKPAGTGTMLLELPIHSMASLADVATRLDREGPRRYPVDAAKVIGPVAAHTEVRLTLPPGWQAHLPPAVKVDGRWGRYEATYAQDGRELLVTRYLEGARGIYPPSSVGDLAEWLRAVARDETSYLVIDTGTRP